MSQLTVRSGSEVGESGKGGEGGRGGEVVGC